MSNRDDGCYNAGILLMCLALQFTVGILVRGWVVAVLWGWFIAPVFDLALITTLQAFGLSLTLCFLRPVHIPASKDKDNALNNLIVQTANYIMIEPLFALGIGAFARMMLA